MSSSYDLNMKSVWDSRKMTVVCGLFAEGNSMAMEVAVPAPRGNAAKEEEEEEKEEEEEEEEKKKKKKLFVAGLQREGLAIFLIELVNGSKSLLMNLLSNQFDFLR
ncbi:hypothetical protein Dimus_039205 [Dionaea muscipula]